MILHLRKYPLHEPTASLLDNANFAAHCSLSSVNPLYATTHQGTIGELFVQLRLLEHDVQAAPPVKDSGNDLIAIKGQAFRAIQVRSTINETIHRPDEGVLYDILAIVKLKKTRARFVTDGAKIYLFPRSMVNAGLPKKVTHYSKNLLSPELIDQLFQETNR